jgi:DNA-binding transcriptional LysR family regulator
MTDLAAAIPELLLLVEVIEAGGYSAAEQRTGIPKSRLSRRIAALEERLGVCLLVRSSRHFGVTDMGRRLHEHGLRIRDEARTALEAAAQSTAEPAGSLHVACPMALSTLLLARETIAFSQRHARVRVQLTATDGQGPVRVDPYDLVIHPATRALPDCDIVAQRLCVVPYVLVAAPRLLQAHGLRQPGAAELQRLDGIGWTFGSAPDDWRLLGPDGTVLDLRPAPPRFTSDSLLSNLEATRAGLGIARLPRPLCEADLARGELVQVLPGWQPPPVTIYALFGSRRRIGLAARDYLATITDALNRWLQDGRPATACGTGGEATPPALSATRPPGEALAAAPSARPLH